MKTFLHTLFLGATTFLVASGCSKPSDTSDSTAKPPEPPSAAPAASPASGAPAPTPPPAPTTTIAAKPPAPSITAADLPKPPPPPPIPTQPTVTDPQQLLKQMSDRLSVSEPVKADPVLKDISGELGERLKSLGNSAATDTNVQGVLRETLRTLTNGKDQEALAAYEKVVAAKLTPEQMSLARDVKNSLSAFIVQKNFSTLPGAESQVGQLVTAFRTADSATAVQALKQIGANAQLTEDQKSLLGAIASQAAPVVNQATDAIKNALPGLGIQ